jgi:AcrR family transcriptional regulator
VVRPKSKEKQAALLDAAANVVAVQGLGAPTASIAQLAGVAEGTLFRYFATKDTLLNELYLHLKQSFGDSMRKRFVRNLPLEDQVRSLWEGDIDWGIAHLSSVKALNQLVVSESISAATRSRADKIFP